MPSKYGRDFLLIAAIVSTVLASPGAHGDASDPPAVAIPAGTTWVEEIGLYSVEWHGLDGKTGAFPTGWVGMFDDQTGVSATEYGEQNGRRAFLLHPKWRGQSGNADQSYRWALPKARSVHLKFGVAVGTNAVGKSDGVMFRVLVDGACVFEKNTASDAWTDADIDLSAKAGRTVDVTFETDPGPSHDASFDYALWGSRRIEVSGDAAATKALSAAPPYPLDAKVMGWGASSPTFPVSVKPGVQVDTQIVRKPRDFADGLRFVVTRPKGSHSAPLNLPFGNFASITLVAPDGSIVSSSDPSVKTEVTENITRDGVIHRQMTYTIGSRVVRLACDIYSFKGSSARIDVRSDDPYIASVYFGMIGPTAMRRGVLVPYLQNGTVQYLPDQALFTSVFVDFARSQASSIDGATARYGALTDGTRNPVRETAYFAVTPDFASVLPTPPNPASPYRVALGGKIIVDHWRHVPFAENAAWLDLLASYGLTDILTIVHNWQNGGYDNKLPDTTPAQAALGGDEGLRAWIAAAKRHGEMIALHDNYADLYPNAASFDWADVAHEADGKPMLAWKNLIQSYAVAPASTVKISGVHTAKIHDTLAPNAGYLDVNSSTGPSFHIDFQAGKPDAGKMQAMRKANTQLWALTRKIYGGPALGEGSHDWIWAGLLDGVEGQFGVGVPSNGGQIAPLFVDFALLKVHPRMLNHGMGYLERWMTPPATWTLPARLLDQYRMQELIYGHAGFVANPLVDSLPFLWQEHNLMLPVTRRYAATPVRSIQYEVNGALLDTNAAVAVRSSFDRARVTYANGLTVTANGRDKDWVVPAGGGKVTLAPFGWIAEGHDLLAYTARRGGRIVDFARTPDSIFANCRAVPMTVAPKQWDAKPSVARFTQTGARTFDISFAWSTSEKLPAGEAAFVHVVRADSPDLILFQMPAAMPAPQDWPTGRTEGQSAAVTLPTDLPDGDYSIRTGLYSPERGDRLALSSKDDGGRRCEIGVLHVREQGAKIELQRVEPVSAITPVEHPTRPSTPINFGPIATDESVMMKCYGGLKWRVTPLPRDTPFTVAFDPAALGLHSGKLVVKAMSVDGRVLGAVPIVSSKVGAKWRQFTVNTVPGAVCYELTSKGRS
jgi:hypothetical protein